VSPLDGFLLGAGAAVGACLLALWLGARLHARVTAAAAHREAELRVRLALLRATEDLARHARNRPYDTPPRDLARHNLASAWIVAGMHVARPPATPSVGS
jgi:hypothetical protein